MKSKDIAIKKVKGFSSAYPNICNLKLLPNIDGTWITIQDDVGTSMTIKLSELSDFIKVDILDKIIAEIEETYMNITYQENKDRKATWGLRKALQIIDKYKTDREE